MGLCKNFGQPYPYSTGYDKAHLKQDHPHWIC